MPVGICNELTSDSIIGHRVSAKLRTRTGVSVLVQAKHSFRRKAAVVVCLFALLLVSSVQLAHSCPTGSDEIPAAGERQSTIVRDAVCFLCLTNFSADSPAPVIVFVPSPAAEFAVADAQPRPYQSFHEFLLTIRPPPAA